MRNPFTRPETTPQWLLSSGCWTVACLGGWVGSTYLALNVYDSCDSNGQSLIQWLLFGGFWVLHGLIWWKGVAGSLLNDARPGLTAGLVSVAAGIWWAALVLFQLACLLMIPLFFLLITTPSDPNFLRF